MRGEKKTPKLYKHLSIEEENLSKSNLQLKTAKMFRRLIGNNGLFETKTEKVYWTISESMRIV